MWATDRVGAALMSATSTPITKATETTLRIKMPIPPSCGRIDRVAKEHFMISKAMPHYQNMAEPAMLRLTLGPDT